jgi:methylmalonyl-CoA mutase N-terminal domain/subunit
VNLVRVTLQALAAVLGGTQSLHTNALDEAWALPTEAAALLALRTQQVIAHESGVTDTADPLGGSFHLERLTCDLEKGAYAYFDKIDALGGMIPAIECGYPMREIAEAAYRYQKEVERGERIIVGVNAFQSEDEPIEILQIDRRIEEEQIARLRRLRAERSNERVERALDAVCRAAEREENLMPPLIDAVRAYATLGEMCGALKKVFGVYREAAVT